MQYLTGGGGGGESEQQRMQPTYPTIVAAAADRGGRGRAYFAADMPGGRGPPQCSPGRGGIDGGTMLYFKRFSNLLLGAVHRSSRILQDASSLKF